MARTARRLETQGTLPGGAAYTPSDEDYVSPAERAQILAMFKPAGRQRFSNKAEQREYLRLVAELQRPVPALSGAQLAWLVAGTVVFGIVSGLIWRRYRVKRAQDEARERKMKTKTKIGLDVFAIRT